MITLLSSLIGFISAMFPEFLKLVQDHKDKKHELEILRLQIEQQSLGHTAKLEEVRVGAEGVINNALYKTWKSGVPWVDTLNGSVRPVIAYSFFVLYASLKVIHTLELPWLFWTEEDQAIFASIITFYFGQRAINKSLKR